MDLDDPQTFEPDLVEPDELDDDEEAEDWDEETLGLDWNEADEHSLVRSIVPLDGIE